MKTSIWWNAINSIIIFLLWIFILFTYGEFPTFKNRISKLENNIESINYYLQYQTKPDTIVINNYFYQTNKK